MTDMDLSTANIVWLLSAAAVVVLWMLLVISFVSRARVFCQYLALMTGIELEPGLVKTVFKERGRGGVRDMLMDLLIREDLSDPDRVVTPDSKPDTSAPATPP